MSDQDYLKKSLVDFQSELENFKGIQETLNQARENLISAEHSWNESTAENKQSIKNVIEIVSSSIESNLIVTEKLGSLCEALGPLVKSIEAVNFPLRLDKIDMASSTQAATLVSIQSLVINEFREIADESHSNSESIADGFALIDSTNERIDKRSRLIVYLLVITVGLEAFILLRNFI